MKLKPKAYTIFCCMVIVISFLYGCSMESSIEKREDSTKSSMEESSNSDMIDEEEATLNDTVSSFSSGNIVLQKTYTLYQVIGGNVVGTYETMLRVDSSIDMETIDVMLVEQAVKRLGYDILLNSLTIQDQKIIVDLSSDSSLFSKDQYKPNGKSLYHFKDYDEWVFGILDSIMMTLTENTKDIVGVIYLEDGKQLQFPDVQMQISFSDTEVYQGYQYYVNLNNSREEGDITNLCNLGMTYNEVLLSLIDHGIDTTQSEKFSVLGDFSKYNTFQSVNDYKKSAWTEIQLKNEEYQFIFDGPESKLVSIYLLKEDKSSIRGLKVGASYDQMAKLYGEDYKVYSVDNMIMYEYQMKDCYFQVFFDIEGRRIVQIGVSTYRQSEREAGKEKIKKLVNR